MHVFNKHTLNYKTHNPLNKQVPLFKLFSLLNYVDIQAALTQKILLLFLIQFVKNFPKHLNSGMLKVVLRFIHSVLFKKNDTLKKWCSWKIRVIQLKKSEDNHLVTFLNIAQS